MKTNITKIGQLLIAFGIFSALSSCEKTQESEDPAPSVSQMINKVETLYDGISEKIETVGDADSTKRFPVYSDEIINKVLAQLRENEKSFEKRFTSSRTSGSSIFGGYDVGVIPVTQSCPSWSNYVEIKMDNEDDNNSSFSSGFVGNFRFDNRKNSFFGFCRVDGRLFGKGTTYSVLALAESVPAAFESVTQVDIDNEDDNNANSQIGSIHPSTLTSNTHLRIYTTQSGSSPVTFPDLGFPYAVFGGNGVATSTTGTHFTDDENSNFNTNTMIYLAGTNAVTVYQNLGNTIGFEIPGIYTSRSGSSTTWKILKVR